MTTKYYTIYWNLFKYGNLKAFLYRIWINIGIFLRLPIVPLGFSRTKNEWAFCFWRNYDEIWYIFKTKKYISLNCNGTFNSLKEIDQFWEDWEKEMMRDYSGS